MKIVEAALSKSSHKQIEVVSNIAEKFNLRINLVKSRGGIPCKDLCDEQKYWMRNVLDCSDLSRMNPEKKEHVYVGKSNDERK